MATIITLNPQGGYNIAHQPATDAFASIDTVLSRLAQGADQNFAAINGEVSGLAARVAGCEQRLDAAAAALQGGGPVASQSQSTPAPVPAPVPAVPVVTPAVAPIPAAPVVPPVVPAAANPAIPVAAVDVQVWTNTTAFIMGAVFAVFALVVLLTAAIFGHQQPWWVWIIMIPLVGLLGYGIDVMSQTRRRPHAVAEAV